MPQTRELFIKRQIYQNYTRQNRAHAFLTNDGSFIATLLRNRKLMSVFCPLRGRNYAGKKRDYFLECTLALF